MVFYFFTNQVISCVFAILYLLFAMNILGIYLEYGLQCTIDTNVYGLLHESEFNFQILNHAGMHLCMHESTFKRGWVMDGQLLRLSQRFLPLIKSNPRPVPARPVQWSLFYQQLFDSPIDSLLSGLIVHIGADRP